MGIEVLGMEISERGRGLSQYSGGRRYAEAEEVGKSKGKSLAEGGDEKRCKKK